MAGTTGAKWGVEGEVLAVLRASPAPLTVREIVTTTGRSKDAVQKWLGVLHAEGRVARSGHGGRRAPWRYSIPRRDGA